jgi:hypothetical protein
MKRVFLVMGFAAFLSGCSWIHHDKSNESSAGTGSIAGPDYGAGRGTTGISSGADAGHAITGSDAAPSR